LQSDVVAVGKVEDAGGWEDLDLVMPYEGVSTRHAVQRFKIAISRIDRDTMNGTPVQTNAVVNALAVQPAGSDRKRLLYNRNQSGVFMMQRIQGRDELLVLRWEPMINASRMAMTADAEKLEWGPVSNGLQMATIAPWPAMGAGEDVTLNVLVAIRNVSTGLILVNAFGGDRLVTCRVDGKPVHVIITPPTREVPQDFGEGHVLVLRPNQMAFIAPDGGVGESGFKTKVAAADSWSVQAVYECKREARIGDRTLWAGRLESKSITVKRPAFSRPRGVSPPAPGGVEAVPAHPEKAPAQPQPVAPAKPDNASAAPVKAP